MLDFVRHLDKRGGIFYILFVDFLRLYILYKFF